MNKRTLTPFGALAALALTLALPAQAQDLDWKKLMEKGDYAALAAKLRPYLDLEHSDPKLRRYLELNLEFLARGARPASAGSELTLFRGAKNDQVFNMPPASRGNALMVPNSIRYMRTSWDKRLPRIDGYFREATTLLGGNGDQLRELDRIIEHHKGGGLGKSSNSVKSVLISASTRPLQHFGPPYYILRVAPERAIFNTKGLSSEYEVLLPFWILPTEIVAKCATWEELTNHPLYKESKLKELQTTSGGYGAGGSRNNWAVIEENIRMGRPPLEGVVGLNSFFSDGADVGPLADQASLARFMEKVRSHGGSVELVSATDLRLPAGAQARTYLDAAGKPKVLLRRGAVRSYALVDELTHVIQLERMLAARGRAEVEELLLKAHTGDPAAVDVVNRWEIRAKKLLRSMLPANDPNRAAIDRSIGELERELDPHRAARRVDGTIDWTKIGRETAGGLAHFGLAMFLKELAVVARTGDRLRIDEFFQGLATTDFYVQYGLFSVGAAGADAAYVRFLQTNLERFIRPRFVQSVLRSNLTLAVGMALPEIVGGRFEARAFAINLAGLGLSSAAVKAGVAALRWVVDLKRVEGGARLAERLGKASRLTSVAGFIYTAAETAVVLYFGDMISSEIDAALQRRSAEADVRAATEALVRAQRDGGDVRAALERVAAAHRAYRDVLARPLQDAEAELWARLERAGVDVKKSDDAVRRYRELAAQDPARYGTLLAAAERLTARREASANEAVRQIFDAFDKRWGEASREVYGAPAPITPALSSAESRWALRGAVVGAADDPWGGRTDILARWSRGRAESRAIDAVSDLPGTRLAAYDAEARLYETLAAAYGTDPAARDELLRRAALTREVRDADRAVVLREGPGLATRPAPAAEPSPTVRGFVRALEDADGR